MTDNDHGTLTVKKGNIKMLVTVVTVQFLLNICYCCCFAVPILTVLFAVCLYRQPKLNMPNPYFTSHCDRAQVSDVYTNLYIRKWN